ncbi:unnamed protein product, partial [Vitis vinifera]|uniref:Uncharacterized protein n=1 Tax=Vitis vinifera TaxID=29760 RepID=D7U0I8_VITVI
MTCLCPKYFGQFIFKTVNQWKKLSNESGVLGIKEGWDVEEWRCFSSTPLISFPNLLSASLAFTFHLRTIRSGNFWNGRNPKPTKFLHLQLLACFNFKKILMSFVSYNINWVDNLFVL